MTVDYISEVLQRRPNAVSTRSPSADGWKVYDRGLMGEKWEVLSRTHETSADAWEDAYNGLVVEKSPIVAVDAQDNRSG